MSFSGQIFEGPGDPTNDPAYAQQTLNKVLPAYLYAEYSDDDACRAFFDVYNTMVAQYVSAFNLLNLPIYTQASGPLLDWILNNIYGIVRPVLSTPNVQISGRYGDGYFGDGNPYGEIVETNSSPYIVANDDIYQRIATWNLYRGDGSLFSVRWLKRRVMRFLIGANGSAPAIDQTYQISVTFSGMNQVNIILGTITVSDVEGRYGDGYFGDAALPYGEITAASITVPAPPFSQIFKQAMDDGLLLVPFQKTYNVTVV